MKQQALTMDRLSRYGLALATAVLGGVAFKLLQLPIPWLLGPMITVLIGSNVFKSRYEWPGPLRNGGMIAVGYTIGLAMTGAALQEMAVQLPSMLLLTGLLVLMCAGLAYLVSKLSGTDYKTALLGSIPGGLTQVIALADETEGVNLTVVTVTQVIRLMIIIVCVPLLVFSPLFGGTHDAAASTAIAHAAASWSGLLPNMLLFVPVCIVCAVAGNMIRFPTAYLLGPALGTAVLQAAGLHGPALPALIMGAAQLTIGAYVGLMLKPDRLQRKVRTIGLAIVSGLLLLAGAWSLSVLLTRLHAVSVSTALLSLAPGGMDQMGIIAQEIHADLSIVAGYQLFRTFFIMFAVPFLIRAFFRFQDKRKGAP